MMKRVIFILGVVFAVAAMPLQGAEQAVLSPDIIVENVKAVRDWAQTVDGAAALSDHGNEEIEVNKQLRLKPQELIERFPDWWIFNLTDVQGRQVAKVIWDRNEKDWVFKGGNKLLKLSSLLEESGDPVELQRDHVIESLLAELQDEKTSESTGAGAGAGGGGLRHNVAGHHGASKQDSSSFPNHAKSERPVVLAGADSGRGKEAEQFYSAGKTEQEIYTAILNGANKASKRERNKLLETEIDDVVGCSGISYEKKDRNKWTVSLLSEKGSSKAQYGFLEYDEEWKMFLLRRNEEFPPCAEMTSEGVVKVGSVPVSDTQTTGDGQSTSIPYSAARTAVWAAGGAVAGAVVTPAAVLFGRFMLELRKAKNDPNLQALTRGQKTKRAAKNALHWMKTNWKKAILAAAVGGAAGGALAGGAIGDWRQGARAC